MRASARVCVVVEGAACECALSGGHSLWLCVLAEVVHAIEPVAQRNSSVETADRPHDREKVPKTAEVVYNNVYTRMYMFTMCTGECGEVWFGYASSTEEHATEGM